MKAAAADYPHQEIACVPERAVVDVQAPLATKPEVDEIMHDMLLHD